MRALLLGLLFTLLAAPAHSQADADLCVVTHHLPYTPYVVETEATALAESLQYLETTAPAGPPTALVAGDLFLRIDDHPFTVFIRPTARHTELRLESRRPANTPEERAAIRARAEAFVQQLAERLG